jgi:transposase
MNGTTFANIVRTRLGQAIREAYGHGPPPGGWNLSLDGERSFHCPAAKAALRRARINIHHGPPNSGDLRPIENWWPDVEKRLRRGTPATRESYEQYAERTKRALKATRPAKLEADIRSHKRRFALCVKNKGGRVDY